jgi:hypothetical protein
MEEMLLHAGVVCLQGGFSTPEPGQLPDGTTAGSLGNLSASPRFDTFAKDDLHYSTVLVLVYYR